MGRPSDCNCCDNPLPDCFGCTGKSGSISDAMANIGDGMTWDKPFFHECDIPLNVYWPGGLNCDLWGPQVGTECGVLSAAGSTHVKFHSSGIKPFNGSNLLQRNPTGGCTWKKRDLKLLQQVYRDSYPGATPAGNVIGYHVENVTYPYADPVDPSDQWSDIVYPSWDPGLSVSEKLYAVGANNFVSTILTLSVETLRTIVLDGGIYDCWKDIPVRGGVGVPSVGGEKYWVLELFSTHKWAGSTVVYSTGVPIGIAGLVSGNSRPYDGRQGAGPTTDFRNPAKDLAACPPYIKSEISEYCVQTTGSLLSASDGTILRWVKKVDCGNDFLGNPITLSLTTPRSFIDSGAFCQCLDFEINARKFGLTGYSKNATITLLP